MKKSPKPGMFHILSAVSMLCLSFLSLFPAQPAGAAWSADPEVNLPLSILPDNQMYPKIVRDASGNFFAGWLDWLDGHPTFYALKVYVQKLDAGGNILWQVNGVPASPVIAQSMYDFTLESDGLGGVYVVWNCAYMDLNGNGTLEEGEYLNHDRLYAQRLNALGQPQWVNPVRVDDIDHDVEAHSIVSDGQNGIIVHWISDYPHERPLASGGSRDPTVLSVCVQRINPAGNRLWGNYGIQVFEPWDQTLAGGEGSAYGSVSSFYALTAPDGAGGAFLGFNFYRNSSIQSYMEAIRIDSNGLRTAGSQTTEGTVLGINNSPSPGDAAAIPSSDGGAIITWQTNYGSGSAYPDIYAQKVGSDGGIRWGAGGVGVCTAEYIQGKVVGAVPPGLDLDTDGDGGAIIAWEDYRFQATVYARRVDRNGSALWGDNGITVARTDTHLQYEPRVSSDGQGGAIISWSSYYYGSNILAQRLNGNGEKLWLQDMALTTAPENQNWHQATPDGQGGAVAVWMDYRDYTTSSDIYAQGIMSNGSLPTYYALTMAVSPAGGGFTHPPVGTHTYPAGTSVNITATADKVWRFVNWSGADNNTANPSTVTMSTNKTVTANFAQITYTLTIATTGNGATSPVAGAHSYLAGTSVNITAFPATGWYFSHWSGDVMGNPNPASITMNSDKALRANFAPTGVTLVESIRLSPGLHESRWVRISGTFRGWEAGHGSPPVNRSDWIIADGTGSIYVSGRSLGLKHPGDIGKPVTVTGIVRLKSGQPYIEVKGPVIRR